MKKRTTLVGVPVFEGLAAIGPRRTAVAVRKTDGSIVVQEMSQGRRMVFFERLPLFRGCIQLGRQLYYATIGLSRSADSAGSDTPVSKATSENPVPEAQQVRLAGGAPASGSSEAEDSNRTAEEARLAAGETGVADAASADERVEALMRKSVNPLAILAILAGVIFGVVFFLLFPRFVVDILARLIPKELTGIFWTDFLLNAAEGLLRVGVFLVYLTLVSRIKEIARMWQYQGAWNKVVAGYEAGDVLSAANIQKHKRYHYRCGMAFLFVVVLVTILLLSLAGAFFKENSLVEALLIRLVLVPVIAGFVYEMFRLVGRADASLIGRILLAPVMWMQRLTVLEPDTGMLEAAIVAAEAVLPEDGREDVW